MRTVNRSIRSIARALGAAGALALLLESSPAQRFNWLGPIEVRSVSNAGQFVGKMGARAVRGMRRIGAQEQPTLGGNHSEAWGITHNGRVQVGLATDSLGRARAYRQTPVDMQDLGVLGSAVPSAWSEARDVAQDGAVVVGGSIAADGFLHAFRWTESGGMQDLGTLGGQSSLAYGVSADGQVVVGAAHTAQGQWRPFRWTASGGMQELGTFGARTGDAWAASADGSIVVGAAHNAQGQWRAFRWTASGGLQELGTFGGAESGARDISADGKVIVGLAKNPQGQWRAFRWTQQTGLQDLTQTYAALIGAGSYLEVAQSVSPNGRFIVGVGYNAATGRNEGYILETEPPRPGRIRFLEPGFARPLSISLDGRVVVGTAIAPAQFRLSEPNPYNFFIQSLDLFGTAFRWTPTGGLQAIASSAAAVDVSGRGYNIVGTRLVGLDQARGFIWTADGGLRDLPLPSASQGALYFGYEQIVAMAAGDHFAGRTVQVALGNMSGFFEWPSDSCYPGWNWRDRVVLFWYDVATPSDVNPWVMQRWFCWPFYYVMDTSPYRVVVSRSIVGFDSQYNAYRGEIRLPSLGEYTRAMAISEGWVSVGSSKRVAVRWDRVNSIYPLGRLPAGYLSQYSNCAYAISADSSVIVGAYHAGFEQAQLAPGSIAWRYTDADGMEDLTDTYAHLLEGHAIVEARAVSYDGRYLACTAVTGVVHRGIWLDTWREGDTNGDGCVDDADLLRVLFVFGTAGSPLLIDNQPLNDNFSLRHEDINGDGIVDDADLLLVLFNFGQGC